MNETFKELFVRGYQARREDRLADSRAIFIEAVRKASIEADRPSLAEALCGLAQAERDIGNPKAASHHYANAAMLYRQVGRRRGWHMQSGTRRTYSGKCAILLRPNHFT
jgi:hypothetical protein